MSGIAIFATDAYATTILILIYEAGSRQTSYLP
jgi:hypothetical protein